MAYGDGKTLDANSLAAAKSWLAEAPRTAGEIAAAGQQFGLSSSQLGQVFGASGADIEKTGYGTASGLNSSLASHTYSAPTNSWSAPPAAAPAPPSQPGAYNGGAALSQAEIDYARSVTGGQDGQWAAYQAQRLGMTADQFGQVFGWSGQDVKDVTGYGTDGGFKSDPYADYVYDAATNSWGLKKPKHPTTGINLSQLQGVTKWDVAPNQTVQSQLEQIIAADSPLMQQARARALQQANARGLLNSSMAVTAGHSAVLENAMPIAQQDASTYARAGEFNANSANTFARDNNAFVRDAFMADFNLGANEWAAQQDFDRQYKMLDRQQQLQLERDAVQNGYQTARDRYVNDWNIAAADKEAALRLQLGAMNAPVQQNDSSVDRLNMQINANKQEQGLSTLNNARSNFSSQMLTIATSGLSGEAKDKAISDLTVSTNAIIRGTAQQLGWDANSWLIKTAGADDAPAAAPTPAPAAPPASSPGDNFA